MAYGNDCAEDFGPCAAACLSEKSRGNGEAGAVVLQLAKLNDGLVGDVAVVGVVVLRLVDISDDWLCDCVVGVLVLVLFECVVISIVVAVACLFLMLVVMFFELATKPFKFLDNASSLFVACVSCLVI